MGQVRRKKMNNAFVRQLTNARNKGVEYGIRGMAMMAVIAVDNIIQDYHEGEERKKIVHEVDAEILRVWEDFKKQTVEKNTDINELIVGYYERVMDYGDSAED